MGNQCKAYCDENTAQRPSSMPSHPAKRLKQAQPSQTSIIYEVKHPDDPSKMLKYAVTQPTGKGRSGQRKRYGAFCGLQPASPSVKNAIEPRFSHGEGPGETMADLVHGQADYQKFVFVPSDADEAEERPSKGSTKDPHTSF